ncbi:MAG: anthranilate phosphoribosyltransferase [Gammaproteobacteria bacterium]|nr:anthranilate phosphoribosyltransferase [Gammaproteobacteria bacterium]
MTAIPVTALTPGQLAMRTSIQKVATGPEYSKDLSLDEAHAAMAQVLSDNADPVQTAVFFIALRMKRETDNENKGVLKAILEAMTLTQAPVDEVFDIGDPYDGHSRGLPVVAFLPAVLGALGVPTVSHGVELMGPKYGVTQRKVLRAAGKTVDLSPSQAAARLAQPDLAWAYVDQHRFAPRLHNLSSLRARMIKRQVLTTVEVLVGPIRGRRKTHLLTGYVHKAYPPIYSELARFAGFDSAMVVRGVEGGVIPSLQQTAKLYSYHDRGQEQESDLDPKLLGIHQTTRAIPLPKDLQPSEHKPDAVANPFDPDAVAARTAEVGLEALHGKPGPARDSLIYAAALVLRHLGRAADLTTAATRVRQVLDNGKALAHFTAG